MKQSYWSLSSCCSFFFDALGVYVYKSVRESEGEAILEENWYLDSRRRHIMSSIHFSHFIQMLEINSMERRNEKGEGEQKKKKRAAAAAKRKKEIHHKEVVSANNDELQLVADVGDLK